MLEDRREQAASRPADAAGERGVRVRGPLPDAVGRRAEGPGPVGRQPPPAGLGDVHGRRLPDDRRAGRPGHRQGPGHGRRLDHRPGRRRDDDAQGVRATWSTSSPPASGGGRSRTTNWSTAGRWCLAEPGRQYLVYLPQGGRTTLKLAERAVSGVVVRPPDGEGSGDRRRLRTGVVVAVPGAREGLGPHPAAAIVRTVGPGCAIRLANPGGVSGSLLRLSDNCKGRLKSRRPDRLGSLSPLA